MLDDWVGSWRGAPSWDVVRLLRFSRTCSVIDLAGQGGCLAKLSALGCLHRIVCTGFLSGFGYFRLEAREIPSFSSTHLYFYLS